MKLTLFFLLAAVPAFIKAQPKSKTAYVFIITTDGFRWQEVFSGADSSLVNNTGCNADTSFTKSMYWEDDPEARRKKLLPFFWNVIAKKGQLYGNRLLGNQVNVKNLYKISYPGYNELLTGYADLNFIPNTPVYNRNTSILEKLNRLPAYSGQVAAFTSWSIFPYIFNEKRSKFTVNSGYELMDEAEDSLSNLIDLVQAGVKEKSNTRHDWLTYLSAKEYIFSHHPKVLFLGLGETDEAAHHNRYDLYLQHAAMVDKMIADLWYCIQTNPVYKDKTTFFITTDHGRGNTVNSWHNHGTFTRNSGQTWLAILGPETYSQMGEISSPQQIYNNQLAATVALLLGEEFISPHHIGQPLLLGQAHASRP